MKLQFIFPILWCLIVVTGCTSKETFTVTNENFRQLGWQEEEIHRDEPPIGHTAPPVHPTDHIDYMCLTVPPAKKYGVAKFELPIPYPNASLKRIRLRNIEFSGMPLKDVAVQSNPANALMYTTYIVHNTSYSNINLVLQVDNDNDNVVDINLAFNSSLQARNNSTADNVPEFSLPAQQDWQTWNASAGWWFVGVKRGNYMLDPTLDPNLPNNYFTLGEYLAIYPNARIMNDPISTDPYGAVRFTIGGDTDEHLNFEGYMGSFQISKHLPGFGFPRVKVFDYQFGDCSMEAERSISIQNRKP